VRECARDSSNAFILQLPVSEGVSVSGAAQTCFKPEPFSTLRWSLKQSTRSTRQPTAELFERSAMYKVSLSKVALSAVSVLWVAAQLAAATLQEDFATDPAARGWKVFGDAALFSWNRTNQNLQVTWDSSLSNSLFYHPLGTVLTRDDDFRLAFDLRLDDIGLGVNTNKAFAFEIALGLLNLHQASGADFLRGTGANATNLVEFDYFRDAGYGATIWPELVDTNGTFNYNGPSDYMLLELTKGDWFHVDLAYTASNQTLVTTMARNGAPFGALHAVTLNPNFSDFRVDAFSITSYTDAGDDYDSVLAHGVVDNIAITTPPPPVADVVGLPTGGQWQVQFLSQSNWLYTLERTGDFAAWTSASPSQSGNGSGMVLSDSNAPPQKAFYRVRAERP
jgi:hypothetical protein